MFELPLLGRDETVRIAPSKIIAIGLNYTAHISESASAKARGISKELPSEPVLFAKTPNVLIPPGSPIVLPAIVGGYEFRNPRTDYEGELALLIGRRAKRVSEAEALGHVCGYTCMNDVSQRNIQNSDVSGWFRGKCFDTFGPIGPVVVPAETMKNPQALAIQTRLNGTVVQDSNTAAMIFGIPRLISFISHNLTLEPGDIIATGTPSGVGPLSHGDVVEVEIEGIGTLRNPVVAEET
ncbi:MAG: fumarylacetoacetate hydrolase family protein [Myxococcota bacterium]